MKLTDILPVKQWRELEKEIFERSGLNPSIYDAEGFSVTGTVTQNTLCHKIKADPHGRISICSHSHQLITGQAKKQSEPIIGLCHSGQAKIIVPIFHGVSFLGVVSGCGLVPEYSELNTDILRKILGMNDAEIEVFSGRIPRISGKTAEDVANYIKDRIEGIMTVYMMMQK